MKKIFITIALLLVCSGFVNQMRPTPLDNGLAKLNGDNDFTGDNSFDTGIAVGGTGSIITFNPNSETIDNTVDDIFAFSGGASAFSLDLSGSVPALFSTDGSSVAINDFLFLQTPIYDLNISASRALDINSRVQPSVSTNKNAFGIAGFVMVGGSNFGAGSVVTGIEFGNVAYNVSFGLGDGGSTDVEVVGMDIYGAYGLSATFTTGDITGAKITPAKTGVTISGDAVGIAISESGSAVTGSQILLNIADPTQGATDHQIVLEGDSAGGGVWFGGTGGCRIYQTTTCTDTMIVDGTTKDLCAVCP